MTPRTSAGDGRAAPPARERAGLYSARVERAVTTMLEAHGLRRRKAGRGFEASHALSVAFLTADFGFDEDTVVAALLHDTLEDTDLDPRVIEERFGALVRRMVEDVSEPPRPARWKTRKLAYLERLGATPRLGALAVASADKIHNLTKMTAGVETRGGAFLEAFTTGLDEMLWYQNAVYDLAAGRWSHAILREHRRRLDAFAAAAAGRVPITARYVNREQ